ncbi:aminoacyltransferase [Candidatus Saccharibacteria bacterium]|nr:aminoacyltransferase [Candidatus Saccharibacteria bacterium]
MEFGEVSEADFRVFCSSAAGANYTQSVEMARLRKDLGWETGFYGVRDKSGELVLAGLVGWKGRAGDCYGGPVGDFAVLDVWTAGMKKVARAQQAQIIYMNPIRTELFVRGWKKVKAVTPHFVYVKKLGFSDEAEMRKSLKQNARTGVNKAVREGVSVRDLGRSELGVFAGLMEETAGRQRFSERGLEYYEKLFDTFRGDYRARFVVAEVQGEAVFGGCFIEGGSEVVYLFGGNKTEALKYQGNYLAVWEEMRAALSAGYKEFNFYGFSGREDDPLLRFKKNWNGEVREYVGRYAVSIGLIGWLKLLFTR